MMTLYDRYSHVVYSCILPVVREEEVAEELLHMVFLQLWEQPAKFQGAEGALAGRLAVSARHCVVDHLRQQRAQMPSGKRHTVDDTKVQAINSATNGKGISRVLEQLPEEERKVFQLAYFEGMTHAEISAHMGTPLNRVKAHLQQASATVRRFVRQGPLASAM